MSYQVLLNKKPILIGNGKETTTIPQRNSTLVSLLQRKYEHTTNYLHFLTFTIVLQVLISFKLTHGGVLL